MDLLKYKCIIFDLDGTIYFGASLADKANDVIKKSRNIAENVFFITNNSAKTRAEIWEKLASMGIVVKQEEIITSGFAIAKYLSENNFKKVYCLGTASLKKEIASFNIDISCQSPQAIVVGYNKDFKLCNLEELLKLNIEASCKLIVANKERCYPSDKGYILPGAGPIVSAVENVLDKKTDLIIGKPNALMLETMLSGLNIAPDEVCVIGDSYESDIKMAQNYGADSFLITNQEYTSCKTIDKLSDLLKIFNER